MKHNVGRIILFSLFLCNNAYAQIMYPCAHDKIQIKQPAIVTIENLKEVIPTLKYLNGYVVTQTIDPESTHYNADETIIAKANDKNNKVFYIYLSKEPQPRTREFREITLEQFKNLYAILHAFNPHITLNTNKPPAGKNGARYSLKLIYPDGRSINIAQLDIPVADGM